MIWRGDKKEIEMTKIVKLSSSMEREEKLKEFYEKMEDLKNEFTAIVDLYEEAESGSRNTDMLIEALDALEDASEVILEVVEG